MIYILFYLLITFPLFSQDLSWEGDDYFFANNEGITVVGTVQTSQQIAVIEKEQVELSGAGDIVNLMQDTLGLNIVRYGVYGNQAGINLRGFDSKRIAFLINGIPVNTSPDGKFDINQIDLNSVERIEVIYGGSDTKYNVSGAFGGIVNIITVKKQEQGLRLAVSISNTSTLPGNYFNRSGEVQNPHWEDLIDTQNLSLSAVYGREAFSFSGSLYANRAENHFIFTDRIDILRRKDNNEVKDAGVGISFIWELENLTKLIAASNFHYSDRNFPTSGYSINSGNQQDFSARQNFMIDKPQIFNDDFSTEVSLTWQFNRLEFLSSAKNISLHDQHNISVINRWNWFAANWLTLRSGFDFRYILLDSTEIGNRSRGDGGIYLTSEFLILEKLLVIPSAKVIFTGEGIFQDEVSGNLLKTEVIPKLGLLWNISENITVKNNYYRNFKFPDFEELYWSGGIGSGNPNLRPEDGYGADLGLSWRITKLLQTENTFFVQKIHDSIHWFSGTGTASSGTASNGGIWQPENVGEAVLFGLDSKISFEKPVSIGPINKIAPSVSYQYLLSYLLSYGYTYESNKRIPYNPEHTINAMINFYWLKGSFFISGRYESLRFHDTVNITELKPVFLLNAGMNQKIGNNLTMFGTLRNILNSSYESFYDYPMPGISLTLGVRAGLEFK